MPQLQVTICTASSFLKKIMCCVLNLPLSITGAQQTNGQYYACMYVSRYKTLHTGFVSTAWLWGYVGRSHMCGEGASACHADTHKPWLEMHRCTGTGGITVLGWYEASAEKTSSCAPPCPHRCNPLLDTLHLNPSPISLCTESVHWERRQSNRKYCSNRALHLMFFLG